MTDRDELPEDPAVGQPQVDADSVGSVAEPLGRSAAAGTLWLTGQKWAVRLSGFVTIAILTRLVSPEEFGVVAAAATVTPVLLLLADMGLSAYIVQADEVDPRTLDTAFWFSVATSLILAGGMALAAPLLAEAFGIEGSTGVLRGMALSVLVTVPFGVPMGLLRRRLQFKLLALQGVIATLIAQAVAIALAFAGAGAWALVAQLIVSQACGGVMAWKSATWWPGRRFSRSRLAAMTGFGGKAVAVDLLTMVRAMLEAAIISHALGAAALGYMSVAQRLVQVAQDAGAATMVPVAAVVFAKVRDTKERLQTAYSRALRIGYAAAAPLLTFVAVDAAAIVPLLFGDSWSASIPVSQALAVAAILVLGAMIDNGLFYGVGALGRWFVYQLGIDGLMLGTTFVLAPHGLTWVAVGFVVTAFLATVLRWVFVGRLIDYPIRGLAFIFFRSAVPVIVSAVGGTVVRIATGDLIPILGITLVGLTVALAHLVTLRLVSRHVLADILGLLPIPDSVAGIRRLA